MSPSARSTGGPAEDRAAPAGVGDDTADATTPDATAQDVMAPDATAQDVMAPDATTSESPRDPLPVALRQAIEAATTARLFLPGGPSSYDTGSWLRLRADHAAARDAVHSDLDLDSAAFAPLVERHAPAVLETAASGSQEYLTRPDLGRRLSAASARALDRRLGAGRGEPAEMAIVVGDGLSATAVTAHAPALVEALVDGAVARRWRVCDPLVVVRRCRVGLLNDIGPRLDSDVVVLLVGERPGLAAADSLSVYLAHRPGPGHTDADRNLVSGIHERGTPVGVAARRVLDLVGLLLAAGHSGVRVKERLAPVDGGPIGPGSGT